MSITGIICLVVIVALACILPKSSRRSRVRSNRVHSTKNMHHHNNRPSHPQSSKNQNRSRR